MNMREYRAILLSSALLKLTGKTPDGLSVGILEAVTAEGKQKSIPWEKEACRQLNR
ncbi:MAG: hypothetical protein MZV63_50235 [Marinilabiliales bacterium]|nr:hypothetical protein [Marinilabiliales bacterium]